MQILIWGNWGRIPQITCRDTQKAIQSKVFSFLFHIKWDFTLVARASMGWVIPVSQVLRYWGSLGKLGPNTPNHAQGYMKSNPKTSVRHLTSNEVLLLCQGHLRVQLYLSYGCLSIRAIWGNRAQIPTNHMKSHMKSNAIIGIRYPKSWPCHSEC